ncbi:MAG: hypothetical protein ACT4PI_02615 [Actinomycetota bacterium]
MRLLIACTAENSEYWCTEVENLALSVRRFGGGLADTPVTACFVDAVDDEYRDRLTRLDVEVVTVPRSDYGTPPTNKLRMLELAHDHAFDVLLALDCDVIITGDISPWLSRDKLRGTPEHADRLTPAQWRMAFEALDVPEPDRATRMVATGKTTYPFFSSGVLMVPRSMCLELATVWQQLCREYDKLCDAEEQLEPTRWFTDEITLTCAITSLGVTVDPLPISLNLCTTVPVHPSYGHEVQRPYVLHYRNEIDSDGFVLASRHDAVNSAIDAFNVERSATFNLRYAHISKPPWARRLVRWLHRQHWYTFRPVRALRRSPTGALGRRVLQRLARSR